MRGISILILLILIGSLNGCKQFQTQPDFPNIAIGPVIRADTLEDSYVYLKLIDGPDTWERRVYFRDIKIDEKDPKQQLVCTTMNNFTALQIYRGNLEDWIANHCSDK